MVIHQLHGCDSKHLETVPVHETFRGQTVWKGEVEVFELRNHPKASRCYAWSRQADNEADERFVAVLELPPVDSPQAAVKVAIAAEVKGQR